jgi:hypothetical protein
MEPHEPVDNRPLNAADGACEPMNVTLDGVDELLPPSDDASMDCASLIELFSDVGDTPGDGTKHGAAVRQPLSADGVRLTSEEFDGLYVGDMHGWSFEGEDDRATLSCDGLEDFFAVRAEVPGASERRADPVVARSAVAEPSVPASSIETGSRSDVTAFICAFQRFADDFHAFAVVCKGGHPAILRELSLQR